MVALIGGMGACTGSSSTIDKFEYCSLEILTKYCFHRDITCPLFVSSEAMNICINDCIELFKALPLLMTR